MQISINKGSVPIRNLTQLLNIFRYYCKIKLSETNILRRKSLRKCIHDDTAIMASIVYNDCISSNFLRTTQKESQLTKSAWNSVMQRKSTMYYNTQQLPKSA